MASVQVTESQTALDLALESPMVLGQEMELSTASDQTRGSRIVFGKPTTKRENTMSQYKNPKWWTRENDSAWERTKAAFKRDWDQTKHDMGGQEPDINQKAGNTARQASGKEAIPPRGVPVYEEVEPAYRYGYGARSKYSSEYPEWDDELETRLRGEWEEIAPARKRTWMQDRAAIRRGWDYDEEEVVETTDR
jgi:hypothetical protein